MTKDQAPNYRQIARELGLDAEMLRRGHESLQQSQALDLPRITTNCGVATKGDGDCLTVDFSFSFWNILELEGTVTFCPGDCWSARIELRLKILGIPVAIPTIELNCRNTEVSFEANVVLARAKLSLGIRGSRLCFFVSGEACYYNLLRGWLCERFDETLFCLAPDGEMSRVAIAPTDGGCGCGKK